MISWVIVINCVLCWNQFKYEHDSNLFGVWDIISSWGVPNYFWSFEILEFMFFSLQVLISFMQSFALQGFVF